MTNNINEIIEQFEIKKHNYLTIKDNIDKAFKLISNINSRDLYTLETKSNKKYKKHILKYMGYKVSVSYLYMNDFGKIYYDLLKPKQFKDKIGVLVIDLNNKLNIKMGSSINGSDIRITKESLEFIHFDILNSVFKR